MQWYALIAIAIGLLIGLATGGRFHHLNDKRFRWWPLLFIGLGVQAVVEIDGMPAGFLLLLLSYVALITFALVNLRLRGMGVILIGIALNAVVITANSGMPVRAGAVRALGVLERHEPIRIDEVKHTLEGSDTKLRFLGDIIPVPPLREVLSFGDLILVVGLVDLMMRLMRPDRRSRSRSVEIEPGEASEGVARDTPLARTRQDRDDDDVIDLAALERQSASAG